MMKKKQITIMIPCFNEAATIRQVILDFQNELPEAKIVIVDNNSNDDTAVIARKAGASVLFEKKQGKGYAVQKVLNTFDGDVMILVDGDDTYFAKDVHMLLKPILENKADMTVGNRMHVNNRSAFSTKHWWGNLFLNWVLNTFFHTKINDMQSGFRIMNKELIHSVALLARGFSIEPELTSQAIEKGFVIKELPISLQKRGEGSHSKIDTVRDGTIALYTIVTLFRDYRPLYFFSLSGIIFMSLGSILGIYSLEGYFETGLIHHMPLLIVSGFLFIASFMNFIAGLILSSVKRRSDEIAVLISRQNNDK